jgi:acetate---CoA ligase (ADP-forming)
MVGSLQALLAPRSVAVLGASANPSIGRTLVESLLRFGFSGPVYPINPRHPSVAGLDCYPTIADLPKPPDVVACCISGSRVLEALPGLAARGAGAAVVYAGGFAEHGEEGITRQRAITDLCREAGIALCGPNCMGVLNPIEHSTTYMAALHDPARLAGNVALVSQSGSICNGLLTDLRRFGFSLIVSTGNEAVVSTAAFLEYLIDDPGTRVIATFTETVREPDRYIAALDRAAAVGKPVVVLKVGRSHRTRQAIYGHTGGLAGESRVFSEVLRAHRAIEVNDLDELTEVLAVCQGDRWPHGQRIGLTTGSGGQAELILDLAAPVGLNLPPLPPALRAEAGRVIGPITGDGNPLDYWGNGDFATNLPHALATLGTGKNHDAVVYCVDAHDNQPMATPERLLRYAEILVEAASRSDRPHYLMNMRPGVMHAGQVTLLAEHGIPVIGGTRQGLGAIDRLGWWHAAPLRAPWQVPTRSRLLRRGRGLINEFEAKRLLAQYGLPVTRERLVATVDEATSAAAEIGYPVVLKAVSNTLAHKSDLGLVALGLASPQALAEAWAGLERRLNEHGLCATGVTGFLVQEFVADGVELFAGVSRDPDFGLTLAVGTGGIEIEVARDFAIRLLPLRGGDAETMIDETRAGALLAAHRARPAADRASLANCLYALADVATAEADALAEIDLNPIKVLPEGRGCRIVDALIVTTPQENTP